MPFKKSNLRSLVLEVMYEGVHDPVKPGILKKRLGKEIFTIHIQDPKVSFKHFDLIVSPEHDNIKGDNVITTTGAIHYLTRKEIKENSNYLGLEEKNKKLVAFIIGGPNKYYAYTEQVIHQTFNQVKTLFTPDKYKIIVIPSYRTPKEVIKKAYDNNQYSFHCEVNIRKGITQFAYDSYSRK